MNDRWFYADGGQRRGPVPLRELLGALLAAPDPRKVLVWNEGMADWQEAGSVPAVSEHLPPPLHAPPASYAPPGYTPAQYTPANYQVVRPFPIEEVEAVARLYRRLILLVGLQTLAGILLPVLAQAAVPANLQMAVPIAVLVIAVGLLLAIALTAYELTVFLEASWPILWAIAMFLPCLNLLVLLAISTNAQTWCRRYGIEVGFLGPTPESIENLRRRMRG